MFCLEYNVHFNLKVTIHTFHILPKTQVLFMVSKPIKRFFLFLFFVFFPQSM